MENLVAIELQRTKSKNPLIDIFYWKDHQEREVDFVVREGLAVKQLIQVTNASSREEIQKKEIERRLIEFRGNKEYNNNNKLKDKVVILVDDGIATGATMLAAVKWLKEKNYCKRLIVAVPVAPLESSILKKLNQIADEVIVIFTPYDFAAVGQFYKHFDQVSDKEVKEIMNKYGFNPR